MLPRFSDKWGPRLGSPDPKLVGRLNIGCQPIVASDVLLEDANHLRDGLGIVMSTVAAWYNLFRFSSVEMRTPIRYDTIAAIRGIAAPAIADDRVIRNTFRHWQRIHFLHEWIVRRKRIDTVRQPVQFHDCRVFLNNGCL